MALFAGSGAAAALLASYAGQLGGLPSTLVLMLLVGRNRKVMHRTRISGWLAAAGWGVAAIVAGAASIYLVQTVSGKS